MEKIYLFLPAAGLLGKRVWCRSAWWLWSSRPEATCLLEEKAQIPASPASLLPATHHQSWERSSPETSSGQAAT